MRIVIAILLYMVTALAHAAGCTATNGGLSLSVNINCTTAAGSAGCPRSSGVAPFLAFFDASATTTTNALGGAGTVVQDVYFAWDFGDPNASGTGTWANGANPNGNSKDQQNGGIVASHLYVLPIANTIDKNYTVKVQAYDGTAIATCSMTVTAFGPSGVNGFGTTTNTFCASTSGNFTNCPTTTAANQLTTSSAATALSHLASGTRVLFRCGETFSGNFNILNTVNKASIGAYQGATNCASGSTGRPIMTGQWTFQDPANTSTVIPTDIRISDLDFELGATATAIWNGWCGGCFPNVTNGVKQAVIFNTNCTGANQCFGIAATTEGGYIQDTATCAGGTSTGPQCVFPNFGENECSSTHGGMNSTVLFCGAASYDPTFFAGITYNAFIGNNFNGNGMGGGGGGRETFRASACRFCVFANNTFSNANTIGGVFKVHDGNTFGSAATWVGQYLEYNEVSDNLFIGESGGNKVELGGQNDVTDERARFNVFERNWIYGGGAAGPNNLGVTNNATKVFLDTANSSIRNNVVFANTGGAGVASDHQLMVSRRSNAANSNTQGGQWNITGVEAYNNTCYMLLNVTDCVGFVTNAGEQANAAGTNSFAQNNLFFDNSTSAPVTNQGTANTVSNNSTNGATDPLMTNGSTNFSLITDFKPTTAKTGALATWNGTTGVPNYFDLFNFSWIGAQQLGATMAASP